MKHEWRKSEKQLYLPKQQPVRIEVPALSFFTISGEGNPNSDAFLDCVQALYASSYGVKMGLKKGSPPEGYVDYTVYPLEGVWSLNEEAIKNYSGTINKDDLVYKLMIRQPDFLTEELALQMLEETKIKKSLPLLEEVRFEQIEEGPCIQMLHLGSYDNEPASFVHMEEYATAEGWVRASKTHREIYLSDARKVAPEKLKTVLRFRLES